METMAGEKRGSGMETMAGKKRGSGWKRWPVAFLIDGLVKILAVVAGIILSAIIVVIFYDVVMRYFFSAPLKGRQDIVEMGMLLSLMLAAPYGWHVGSHISVDLYDAVPIRSLEWLRSVFVKLIMAGVFGLIAWRSSYAIEEDALFNEATNMILIPHRPFIYVIMVVAAIHACILILSCFLDVNSTKGVVAPGYSDVGDSGESRSA